MKKWWFLVLVLVLLVYGCSKVSEEKPVLNELQTTACESASSNNNCDRLDDLGIVSNQDCCYALNKCCGDGVTGRAVQNTLSDIPVADFKSVLIKVIKSYFSNSPVLTTVELKDLIVVYFSTPGENVDLSGKGEYSGEQIVDIYTKASGKSPTQTTVTTPVQPGLYPKGGEVWEVGKTYTITWSTVGRTSSEPVEISLVINVGDISSKKYGYIIGSPGFEIKAADTTNTGSYNWTVPSVLEKYGGEYRLGVGNAYILRIRVGEYQTYGVGSTPLKTSINYQSEKFSIINPSGNMPKVNVLTATYYTYARAGETMLIEWLAPDLPESSDVSIDIINYHSSSISSSSFIKTLTYVGHTKNTGSFEWYIPPELKNKMDSYKYYDCGDARFWFCKALDGVIRVKVKGFSGESIATLNIQEKADEIPHYVVVYPRPATYQPIWDLNASSKLSWQSNMVDSMCRVWFDCGQVYLNNLPFKGDYNTICSTPGIYNFAVRCFSKEVIEKYGGKTDSIPQSEGVADSIQARQR
ncbi:MAG: hypothetical protein Q8O03_09120 [Nanoarchaeota archaeon]|nr:hypothetical protein [Nanoarchaeota archaeon]